jgi:hypothetical protein
MELARALRPLTITMARESYTALKEYDCATNLGYNRHGLNTLDYFFLGHRLKTKTKRHISFYDAIRDPVVNSKLNALVRRWKRGRTIKNKLSAKYDVFQLYYGTINQFRPTVAKHMYCKLNARVGILDFSAGWGGRALAAMSLNIPYYGFDANTRLESAYTSMIQTLEPGARVRMTFMPSEKVSDDFSKLAYDLVFTSPPYFTIEEYEQMPEYKSKSEFLIKFFIPVATKAWRHLRPGGNMALNMPEEMYDALKTHIPRRAKRYVMPLKNRHPKNAAVKQGLGTEDKSAKEYIYIWHKPKLQTRRKSVSRVGGTTRKNSRK